MAAWEIVQEAQKAVNEEDTAVIDEVYPEVEEEAAPPTPTNAAEFVTQGAFNAAVSQIMEAISGSKSKEASELTAVTARMDALQTQIKTAQTELAELTNAQPRAANGYRATQAPPPAGESAILTRTKATEAKWAYAIKTMGPEAAQFAAVAETFTQSMINPNGNPGNPWEDLA